MVRAGGGSLEPCWKPRDWIAAAGLFLATAGVVLWQNTHLAVLWDLSYVLDSATRIALGQMPYRDFPFAHAPLTFLIQAAIIRLAGRVYFHHALYAAVVGGLGTVLTWRIVLHTLRGRVTAAWALALMLAAPLAVLGIYSILPFPSYDCDCAFSILVAVWLLQRLGEDSCAAGRARGVVRGVVAGAALCVPLFFKQNIGLPFLAAAVAVILLLVCLRFRSRAQVLPGEPDQPLALKGHGFSRAVEEANPRSALAAEGMLVVESTFPQGLKPNPLSRLWVARLKPRPFKAQEPLAQTRPAANSPGHEAPIFLAVLAGVAATLSAAALLLHFTTGLGNYIHWTIGFAAQRRLPGFSDMLGVYHDSNLLWTLPCVAISLLLLRSQVAEARWAQAVAAVLMAAPFVYTLCSLFIYDDADERGDTLLALWPLLLILAAALALWNLFKFRRALSLRAMLPIVLLVAINGTLMSQQLWGSTYAIWPLLTVLIAEMVVFLAERYSAGDVQGGVSFEAAEERGVSGGASEEQPSGAEAHRAFLSFTRGLKPPPPSVSPSAGAKARVIFWPFSAPFDSAQGRLLKSCPDTEPRDALGRVNVFATGSGMALVMAAVVSVTFLVCGGFYMASEERLSYAQFPEGPVAHSAFPQLAGMATPGPYLPDFDELLRFAAANIPVSDGLILIPGEDPFYFATGRSPQFPVLLFDPATDPFSPEQVVEEVRTHQIRWLIVKRELQMKEDPTPQREVTMKALMSEFTLSARLHGYDVYRR
jgi:hypothetical protein